MKLGFGKLKITTEPDTGVELQELRNTTQALQRSFAVIEFDPQGNILSANDNFLATMGYALNEIQHKHHSMFLRPGDSQHADYQAFWNDLRDGQFQSGEYLRINKNGDDVWIQATYNPILDQQGNVYKVIKFASEITRQKAQSAEYEGQINAISKSLAVIHFDLDGRILWANENFLQTMGYALDEVVAQHHRIFVSEEEKSADSYRTFWQQLNNGEFQSGEFHRVAKNGQSVWIQASYNPIYDSTGQLKKIIKYASDITEQKLKNTDFEGQIAAISKTQAVIEFNTDGKILNANENFLATMGYQLAEIQGKHHRMFVDGAYANSPDYQDFWQQLRQGKHQSGEYQRFAKGGKEVWIQAAYTPIFDVNGEVLKIVKYATDITQQKQDYANFQGQISAIGKSQAVIEFDMDGNILTANHNFLATMGYELDEIQGKHHRMFVAPEVSASAEYARFWQDLNDGKFTTGEYQRIAKNGQDVWIQASYNPILDAAQRPFKVVKYATDVTAQKVQNADYAGQIAAIGKSQAVIEFNLDSSILTANVNFLQAMGYQLQEIQGKKHQIFVPDAIKNNQQYRDFWDALRAGEYQSGEFKRITKSGDDIWIQASYNPILGLNGEVAKIVKYATDITQQKMIDADNQGQLNAIDKSQAIIEFSPDATILKANDNFLNTMGYQLAEIQGKKHGIFVTQDYRDSQDYQAFWENLRKGEFQAGEFKRIAKDGSEVWIHATYNPIFDLNGEVYKVVKFAIEVTGRVNAVNAVRMALENLSQGNLNTTIQQTFIPEFESLKGAINSTVDKLRETVLDINHCASEVMVGANEIAQGNQELSNRTEQQASSLEETAASMEELTTTVQENARNSQEAHEIANQTKEKAHQGGQIVSEAIASMELISQSSKKVVDIINVIDEIAFQTNLLALNAAVEAARAGEEGRGFAVVATEVRNLAQRSAGAAKQIKELIQDSVKKVDEGKQLVNNSGDTLEEIIHSVVKVTEMMNKIALSSKEQSTGISEINSAVSQMDNMTQQNAAMVEEATAASDTLKQLAVNMTSKLNYFSLGEQ
ncbi:methyl-accepting chemotaxis protein [Planctobacterium marinum]|uniref:methyl-accepting chemotaxis protein n=1 Tax=Planctobacterium marinum TaxID=1631968 RepID=UPI002B4BA3F1|nr:PAS domain-containing protein [Planctobacterium marinum]